MSDMREQLLKAGLVSSNEVRDAERGTRGRSGRGGAGKTRRKPRAGSGSDEAQRRASADRNASDNSLADDPMRAEAAVSVATKAVAATPTQGSRRWYYLRADGSLPYVQVSESAATALEQGDMAVVAAPDGRCWVVDQDAASRIQSLAPSWLRCWVGVDY